MKKKKLEKKISRIKRLFLKKIRGKYAEELIFNIRIYVGIAILVLVLLGVWTVYSETKYSFVYQPQQFTHKRSVPTFVAIRDSNIFLPVKESGISNGIWEVSEDGVSHLSESARPGENGRVIMYADNTPSKFGPLLEMKTGEPIIISTKDGRTYTYFVRKTGIVNPTDTDFFNAKQGETVILYTSCGFADLQRFVVIAKPQ